MPTAANGATTIHYETQGSPADPPLLLVMGLGCQLIVWPQGLCDAFTDRGFFVIRHDNRDVGLSTVTPGTPPDVLAMLMARMTGQPVTQPAPYTLSDMADDAVAVLDDLGIDRAHVAGASMGGMIVQTMAIDHPERVATMTSIMSTPFAPVVGPSTAEAAAQLMTAPPTTREGYVEQSVASGTVFGGPLFDTARAAELAGAHFDRAFRPLGSAFQMGAIMASGDRTESLHAVTAPTLVIHGRADSLITLPGGEATAAAVPGARLLVLDEMGHDLPEPLWGAIVDAIVGNTARAAATPAHAPLP